MSGGIGGKLTDKACKVFVSQGAHGKKLPDGNGLHLVKLHSNLTHRGSVLNARQQLRAMH